MRTAYEASNAIEAHILQGYLEQEGIAVQVVGAYLQGAIGELPAHGLVRLLVTRMTTTGRASDPALGGGAPA